MAITIDVGKIKLVWKGTYSGVTTYTPDDLVQYDDGATVSAYINVANSTGNVPSSLGTVNTTYWNLVAKGASATSAGTINGVIQYKNSSGFGATTSLYWDSTNNRLGIGSTSPTVTLDVVGNAKLTNLIVTGISTLGVTTFTDSAVIGHTFEKTQIIAATANATSNIDVKSGSLVILTTNSSATWTHNIRGDVSTSLNSILSTGQTITVTIISKQNNTSYYTSALNIDGVGQTVNWINGTTPTSGFSTLGYDAYTWVITKTANATFIVLASQSQYG